MKSPCLPPQLLCRVVLQRRARIVVEEKKEGLQAQLAVEGRAFEQGQGERGVVWGAADRRLGGIGGAVTGLGQQATAELEGCKRLRHGDGSLMVMADGCGEGWGSKGRGCEGWGSTQGGYRERGGRGS